MTDRDTDINVPTRQNSELLGSTDPLQVGQINTEEMNHDSKNAIAVALEKMVEILSLMSNAILKQKNVHRDIKNGIPALEIYVGMIKTEHKNTGKKIVKPLRKFESLVNRGEKTPRNKPQKRSATSPLDNAETSRSDKKTREITS